MRFGRRKLVTVLGAGPAGLLAAHAAFEMGHDVRIFTAPEPNNPMAPRKSELHGCQYLHAYIPRLGLPVNGQSVSYLLEGSADDYRRKVYKEEWGGPVSPDEYGPERNHMAWDLRVAYDKLWEDFQFLITPLELTPNMAKQMSTIKDTVISTVPAPALCLDMDNHKFVTQDIWAMGSVREDFATSRSLPYYAPDFTVLCNGNKSPRWYRAATVFGQSTLEWPAGPRPPIEGIASVSKPLRTDCTCHMGSGRWYRLGRYGQWQKGVLSHHVYLEAKKLLS